MATHDAQEDHKDQPPYDPEQVARRASSFGSQAAAYAEHRPGYPDPAVIWALEPALAAHGGTLHVLDLAAGTGKLSASLLAFGHRVTAVEPDPQMLAELHRRVPGVTTAVAGSAERIPLPDGSVDAVVVGQALHWFDQQRALPEIARVLRPGGSLAALWNTDDDRVDWIAGLRLQPVARVSFVDWREGRGIEAHPAYAPVEFADFPHRQRHTVDSLIATIGTHSHVLVQEPEERERALNLVRDYLSSRPETSHGEFDLEIVTRVQRSVRLAKS